MIDADALRVLEFPRFLEHLATRAQSEMGRAAALAAIPVCDLVAGRGLLAETRDALALQHQGLLPSVRVTDDVWPLLTGSRERGVPMLARELATLLRFVRFSADLRAELEQLAAAPALLALGRTLPDLTALLRSLEQAVDDQGHLLDSATPRLRVIRMELGERKESVRRGIERFAQRPEIRPLLRSAHATIRDGRYVLAVRAGARGQLKGLYHDRSQSGQTVFVEPESLVEQQNELRDLILDEEKEVHRILWKLTHDAVQRQDDIACARDVVARYDLAGARARVGMELAFTEPELVAAGPLELADARHPLLLSMAFLAAEVKDPTAQAGGQGRSAAVPDAAMPETECSSRRERALAGVVPFSVRLGDTFDILVLTGPNTGGKTVTLKTIGLIALLPRIGCFVPCATGARIPLYRGVFADVGDEQDLTQSLSTFSGHVSRIARILREAPAGSLVLLDELGSGTDPLEGEALSTALLDHLLHKGLRAVVTTHLGRLKEFAGRRPRAANASVEFDPESLRPTYRLILGIPGASNALRIARNLGLPREILDHADALARETRDPGTDLYDELDRARAAVERLRTGAEADRRVAREERDASSKEADALSREKGSLLAQAEAAAEARLRRLAEELEEPRRALLRLGGPGAQLAGQIMEAIRRALASTPLAEHRKRFAKTLQPGDRVLLPRFNEICRVRRVSRKDGKVEVEYRSMSVTVGFDEIAPADPSVLPPGGQGR